MSNHKSANAHARALLSKAQHNVNQLHELTPDAEKALGEIAPFVTEEEMSEYVANFNEFGKLINDLQINLQKIEDKISEQESKES